MNRFQKYRENHKAEIAARKKVYRDKNKQKENERSKKYKEEHKEEIAKQRKRYREEHKDEYKSYMNKYRKLNKDKIKMKAKEYISNENNCEKIKKSTIECRACHKKFLLEYMKQFKNDVCPICGSDKNLEWHHRDASKKKFKISDAIARGYTFRRFKPELDKCVHICQQCHRKIHSKGRDNG